MRKLEPFLHTARPAACRLVGCLGRAAKPRLGPFGVPQFIREKYLHRTECAADGGRHLRRAAVAPSTRSGRGEHSAGLGGRVQWQARLAGPTARPGRRNTSHSGAHAVRAWPGPARRKRKGRTGLNLAPGATRRHAIYSRQRSGVTRWCKAKAGVVNTRGAARHGDRVAIEAGAGRAAGRA